LCKKQFLIFMGRGWHWGSYKTIFQRQRCTTKKSRQTTLAARIAADPKIMADEAMMPRSDPFEYDQSSVKCDQIIVSHRVQYHAIRIVAAMVITIPMFCSGSGRRWAQRQWWRLLRTWYRK
jgi:hypothetical protein